MAVEILRKWKYQFSYLLVNSLIGAYMINRIVLSSEQLRHWEDNGFLILKSFFDQKRIDAVNHLVDSLWENRKTSGTLLTSDVFIGTPNERRIYFRMATNDSRLVSYKLNDLYLENEAILDLNLDPRLCNILRELLGGRPLVFNTLNFERGSQQRDHFDTFYMPPVVPNKMLATWIALEKGSESSGPLRYYPGSHKIPPYRFSNGKFTAIASEMAAFDEYISRNLRDYNLSPTTFFPEAGDVFIWHAQLYHGGTPILNPELTRKSLVTHYFRARDYVLRRGWQFRKKGDAFYLRKPHQSVNA